MRILDEYITAFRSLQARIVAISIPLIFMTTFILFALLEVNTYRTSVRDLRSDLEALVASQSAALSIPLRNADETQIRLALTAIVTHPDVVAARVLDETGKLISKAGIDDFHQVAVRTEHTISFSENGEQRVTGRLVIAATKTRIWAFLQSRFLMAGVFAIIVVLCVIASFLLAYRRLIGVPLEEARADLATILEMSTKHVNVMETELQGRSEELTDKTNELQQSSNKLAKYLSPQIYDSIFDNEKEVKVASSRKKLTVFFSDIADFTEITDRLQSEDLTTLLNHYLSEMSRISLEHGATIDKYIGDAIMIFYGDPESRGVKEDALSCVKMAIAMRNRLRDLQTIWQASGIEKPLRCRMGIHTDYCTVGNFGSETRMDYTIVGGGVNIASRLEAAATPGDILISYETFVHVRDQILCEKNGEIDVKGIAYPVATYRVIGNRDNTEDERRYYRKDHPNAKLDFDLETISVEDRRDIEFILQDALEHLSSGNQPDSEQNLEKG